MKERIDRLRDGLKEQGLDGLLITSATNRRYMTGFTGTAGVVLITLDQAKLIVDSRYIEQATNQASEFEVIQFTTSMLEQLTEVINQLKLVSLGFEKDHITFGAYQSYKENFLTELVPVTGLIETLRMVKSAEEIRTIRTAAEIADATFSYIVQIIRPGLSEKDISNEMDAFLRQQGADGSSFDTIVASGYRSALPHGVASTKTIENGDMLTLDFGAYYQGYRSDITRTIAIGEPAAELKAIYDIVLEAELQCIERLKPDISCKEIDRYTHQFIADKGYGPHFRHGTGHGIGLDIHEEPFFSTKSEKSLAAGMIVTVEPGIYIPGLGGVRIEDDVLITHSGREVITRSPKQLISI